MLNTFNTVRHVSPPLMLLLTNVLRASSMVRSNAFATHLETRRKGKKHTLVQYVYVLKKGDQTSGIDV